MYLKIVDYLLPVVSDNPAALECGSDGSILGPIPDRLRAHAETLSKLLG